MNHTNKTGLLPATLVAATLLAGCSDNRQTTDSTMNNNSLTPPVAKKVPYEMTSHGDTRIDNYYWMRDDERKNPEMLAHLEAENAYQAQVMAHTQGLQDSLFEEIVSRINKDETSVPVLSNGYWYNAEFSGDNDYPIHTRRKGAEDGERQVLLDINQLASEHAYFSLGSYAVSTDNQTLAYSADTLSRRIYDIQFKNLKTGELLADTLTGTDGSMVWANDNKTIFYIKKDPVTLLGYQVYRHTLGTPQSDDVLVYEETNNELYIGISKSKDGSTLYIYQDGTNEEAMLVLDANTPQGQFKHFHPMEDGLKYSVQKNGEWYYVHTNWKAENYRLMKVHQDHSADKSQWQEVVGHKPDIYLDGVEIFKDHIVLSQKTRGQIELSIMELESGNTRPISFDESLYVAGFASNLEMDNSSVRVAYTSMTTPGTVYDVDLTSGEKTLKKQEKVLGDFNPGDYAAERIFVAARDGTEVPVSLVYKKSLFKKDGSNPLWQYAYGSYGSTIEPEFRASRLPLLDRGFVYAIAHIRGGKMLGQEWYDQGRMFEKINTFTDFIDVTKALTAQGYGHKDKVFAQGGSAGGLLMGAVANMAPELYRGMHAAVPFVDVVTTMLDESIPLTTNEYGEWGNPNNKDSYDYMLSYSPYDQVKAQNYPNMLVTTGLHDSQVQYFEPMKWVAKLRELKTDDNRLLFKTDMEAGHGGASGRFKSLHETALVYAFMFDLIGVEK
ncbi:S9 family peptidase [Porticoccus sp. W117]|uniref:S9 family peptidase n=1 Tax=Porticoccus sp. W117 TaxID=3054777 RepID=UPI002595AAB3|nr:S9 family peptidase [Porticoccus sp. W117]MDM3870959.1 S9 family peptidase [Porticoccus sp. W117]